MLKTNIINKDMYNLKKNLFNKTKKAGAGFTLIELLIVIAIIGVLSALLMANFVGIRQRARDAQRKSDVRQIQSALEFYRSDKGTYPLTAEIGACGTALDDPINSSVIYMSKIPCDPGNNTYNGGRYYYSSAGSTYILGACLENTADRTSGTTSTSPGGSGCTSNWYYVLNNP